MSTTAGVCKVNVSPDRRKAWMWVNAKVEPSQVSAERLMQAVEAAPCADGGGSGTT